MKVELAGVLIGYVHLTSPNIKFGKPGTFECNVIVDEDQATYMNGRIDAGMDISGIKAVELGTVKKEFDPRTTTDDGRLVLKCKLPAFAGKGKPTRTLPCYGVDGEPTTDWHDLTAGTRVKLIVNPVPYATRYGNGVSVRLIEVNTLPPMDELMMEDK